MDKVAYVVVASFDEELDQVMLVVDTAATRCFWPYVFFETVRGLFWEFLQADDFPVGETDGGLIGVEF